MDARVPFCAFESEVRSEWVDEHGFMHVACYVLSFDQASQHFLENLRMGSSYARDTGHRALVVDMNVTYRRALKNGDPLSFTTQLLAFDDHQLRVFHQMFHRDQGWLAATNEVLLAHRDLARNISSPFPPQVHQRIEAVALAHHSLAPPEGAGRVLGSGLSQELFSVAQSRSSGRSR